jgi:hypothetical protein
VHKRCPRLATLLLQWRDLTRTYTNRAESYLLCNIHKKKEKRTPLYKEGRSKAIVKWNAEQVRNYDQRVWDSSGIEGPHDTTRTASARRTRLGENRSWEMLHNKSQEINYQSGGRKRARTEPDDEPTVRRQTPPAALAAKQREIEELRRKIAEKEQNDS